MSGGYRPDHEVLEVNGRLVVAIDLPGLDARALRVDVVDGRELVVAGRREPAGGRRVSGARPSGPFELRFPLPAAISREHLCVEYRNGVLEVEVRPIPGFSPEHPSTRVGIAGRPVPITSP